MVCLFAMQLERTLYLHRGRLLVGICIYYINYESLLDASIIPIKRRLFVILITILSLAYVLVAAAHIEIRVKYKQLEVKYELSHCIIL